MLALKSCKLTVDFDDPGLTFSFQDVFTKMF
jgi:hypothetical protein